VVTREFLLQPGLTLRYGHQLFFEKPPMAFWLMAASAKVLGFDELALRMPSAVCAIAVVLLTYLLGRRLGGRAAGVLAALLLLGVPQFVAWGRLAMTDTPLVALGVLSIALAVLGDGRVSFRIASGAALGLAILTKSAAALLFVPGLGGALLVQGKVQEQAGRQPAPRLRGALLIGGAALAVALPWHLYELAVHGNEFLRRYLFTEVLARVARPMDNHAGSWWYDFAIYRYNAGPLAFVHAAGVLLAVALAWRRRDRWLGLAALFALAPFAAIFLTRTKIGWYLLPVYPGAALASALAATRIVPRRAAAALCVLAAAVAWPGALRGRERFAAEYNIFDFSPEVRALRGAPPFQRRVPLLYVRGVSEPAPLFYLADRVESIDDAGLRRLAASRDPFLCLTFQPIARDFLAAHADSGASVTASTPSLAIIERALTAGRAPPH
jgi:4-amino-4-deoxy-L-arabinose transferase-like glycosyltransferase